ncbi:PREDICTED: mpv17-like protein 2 [Priapulus caudatus]|uniref:Mpv17-like protein 2 n=1 Tax=Priapulus caudatus TaxID=37621 RepID=A0ABM1E9X5_PRICU|nr:PREDICTED: mpv17-like protein 2 [Priapulus caudatus]XP_014668996.1 PREDICTED: mpv17-like protein 2 [Priapulus caudatus]
MASLLRILRGTAAFRSARKTTRVLFSKYLLVTNVGISMTLSAAGDVLQQHYQMSQGRHVAWDRRRTRHLATSGMTVGFGCHWWYLFLDRKLPGRALPIVLKKMVADQVIFSPVMWSVFFVTLGLLEGTGARHMVNETIFKGQKLWTAELLVWPPAQMVNFMLLPTHYRVLYDNVISLGFDYYASYVKHTPMDT